MMEATEEAQQIARGEQPRWERTFKHPLHGPLEFRVEKLPTVEEWISHANVQEVISPGNPTMLSAAVAGMRTFVRVPVLRENRREDPDTPGREVIEKVYYDPMQDEHFDWVCTVWLDFVAWRAQLLAPDTQEQVKNSSRATTGDADGEPSPATTESHLPTTE